MLFYAIDWPISNQNLIVLITVAECILISAGVNFFPQISNWSPIFIFFTWASESFY